MSTQIKKQKMQEVTLDVTPLMTFSNEFLRNVSMLHRECGKTEWSGILLCEIDGSVKKLNDLQVHVKNLFLCNIGDPAFTTYKPADHIEELGDLFPEYDLFNTAERWDGINNLNGYKLQQIHTH